MTPQPNVHRRAVLCGLGAIALWGTLAALSLELKHVPPFFLVACALILGAAMGFRGIRLRTPGRVVLLGVYGLFAYHFCLFLALRMAPPVEANLINYLWPLLMVVLSPVFVSGTALRPRHLIGALLGFGGAAVLVSDGSVGFSADGAVGYLLAFAAAVIWSTYSLLTKRMGDFPTSTIATFCLVSGTLSLSCHAVFEPLYIPRMSDVPALLLIGLGPMGAAFYLWDRAVKDGDPRVIGTLAYLTPLLSTLFIVLTGEGRFTMRALIATSMIVGGAVIGTWSRSGAR